MFSLLHNLYKYIRTKSERRACLVVLGVDNAGKTTLLNSVQGLEKEVSPTFGFTSTSTTTKALGLNGRHFTLQVFDLGGGKNIRRVWRSYLAEVHAVIFVTDAADAARFVECRDVLHETLQQQHLENKPILVFANKQDLPTAATAAQVADQLGLSTLKRNPYHIMACTAKTPTGEKPDPRIREGLAWVMQAVSEVYAQLHPRVEADALVVRQEEARKKQEREERVRVIKEERARQAAEAAEAATTAAAAEAVKPAPSMQQQRNALLNPLPGGIESPRIGVPPMEPEPATESVTTAVPVADFSDLATGQLSTSIARQSNGPGLAVSAPLRSSVNGRVSMSKPPLHPAVPSISPQAPEFFAVPAQALPQSGPLPSGSEVLEQQRGSSGRMETSSRSPSMNASVVQQQQAIVDADGHSVRTSFTKQNKVQPIQ